MTPYATRERLLKILNETRQFRARHHSIDQAAIIRDIEAPLDLLCKTLELSEPLTCADYDKFGSGQAVISEKLDTVKRMFLDLVEAGSRDFDQRRALFDRMESLQLSLDFLNGYIDPKGRPIQLDGPDSDAVE